MTGANRRLPIHWSRKKMAPTRRNWTSIKRAKADSEKRRVAYCEAQKAFELAERVRQARERAGLTQAELASRIGSTQPAIACLEAGGSTPSFDTLRRIAAALGLELVVALRARQAAA
jgi:ribosome-binding protein aMBF1 (putative translation factor)